MNRERNHSQPAGRGRADDSHIGIFATCLFALCMLSSSASAQKFTIINIDPPGATGSAATAINGAGMVTGAYSDASGSHAFVRFPDGTFASFDAPGALSVSPVGISSAGTITGTYMTPDFLTHGFLRTADGVFTTLFGPNSLDISPTAINAAGTISGYYSDGTNTHGFIRSHSGIFTIFDVPGAFATLAMSINSGGATTGYYFDANGGHGFLRSRGGAITKFIVPGSFNSVPLIPGAAYTTPLSINPAGAIAGYYSDAGGNWARHGFVRQRNGTFTVVDGPGNSGVTMAYGMNAAGEVFGIYYDDFGQQHGLFYTGGKVTSFDPAGAFYTHPAAINSGGWITGDYDGHSFLLIPARNLLF